MTSVDRRLNFFLAAAALLFAIELASGATLWTADMIRPFVISTANRSNCPETPTNRPSNRVNTTIQLGKLREEMSNANLDAYIVLITDEHGSEGTPYHARIKYLSGFSGSNAWIVVTATEAALWTDGRYFLQADDQMDCNWIMMKDGETGYPRSRDWLIEKLSAGNRVGAFPNYVATSTWQSYESALKVRGISMNSVPRDLVDVIWTDNTRPAIPNTQLIVHSMTFAGKSWQDKLYDVRQKMKEQNAGALVVSVLEQIAWLYNLRGDAMSNPLFYSYSIVLHNESRIYLKNYTVLIANNDIQEHLSINSSGVCKAATLDNCIKIFDYDLVYEHIASLSLTTDIWIDPTANYAIYNSSGEDRISSLSPIESMKTIKNAVERVQFAKCVVRDSASLVELMAVLEKGVKAGENWTEISADEKLYEIKRQYENNRGYSFETISGYGSHGAIIHYKAEKETNIPIGRDSTYLLDSGGQYLDGTTDVTRTFHFGTPTAEIKNAYTWVLMGMIDLASTVWPRGLGGTVFDSRGRGPLWKQGLDYNHGTGHGIGYFLNVHEGPGRINLGADAVPLDEGMVFSDEPGYYKDGSFGIRLEILVMIVKAETPNSFGGKQFLTFKPLTLVPFETHLINYDLLSAEQIKWLNAYNERCRNEVGAYLRDVRNSPEGAIEWLEARTQEIPVPSISFPSTTITPPISSAITINRSSVVYFIVTFVTLALKYVVG